MTERQNINVIIVTKLMITFLRNGLNWVIIREHF